MEMTYNGGPPHKGPGRYVKPVAIALALAALAALIWHFAGDTAGVKRASAPQVTTVIPLPPPPPPPPKKPPPEKVKDEVKTPVERPTIAPKPSEAPKPSDDQPKQMTMNAPAQAGTDSFNIGAGDGSGMVGSGGGKFGNASYAQYMVYVLQRAIEQDKGVQEAGGAHFAGSLNLWMDASGRITKVTIAQSTGDAKIDAAVLAAVESLGRVDEAPPPATAYPVLVRLQGRKPA
ncbi:energy transducer TonB family protein [Burkholderia vietnamiensis]|uniref:energy transducer TonB family protein n=1 Tax=Burkholderia vietnamiensis TaxID=60552 RepID=UPI000751E07C|nr:energy transducer TonB [Burkholderia vietnamiensis]KVF30486.1 energy transducer TonB [Burkholderia vietnamiensis]KVF38923.1 energy transducer TonB [Burkholderia vietnamiensis]MBH9642407.1 energy transducer TonB [Burkholderia vietnamiensis]MCA8267944.1 energy transducer TonB [Burkholderia vietnamiensis]MCA8446725.1 energy transducer TonB [Burkholderia vietnamiensis]